MVMALAIGPVTMDLPAAIHLYWVSSATLTLVQSELLKRLMPVKAPAITGCRGDDRGYLRPTRETTP